MIAAITGRFFVKSQSEGSQRFAAPYEKSLERIRVQNNLKDRIQVDNLAHLNVFVEKILSPSTSFTPVFDYLPQVYHALATNENAKDLSGDVNSSRAVARKEYTLTMDADTDFSKIRHEDISIIELESEGRTMFGKKLVYAAERAIISCHSCYHFADLQYLLYLTEHLNEVPRVMKNAKGNIFAGTVITLNDEQYVPVVTFSNDDPVIEIVSLRDRLEDVAQFVIIERNR